jgi:hypothetical protein
MGMKFPRRITKAMIAERAGVGINLVLDYERLERAYPGIVAMNLTLDEMHIEFFKTRRREIELRSRRLVLAAPASRISLSTMVQMPRLTLKVDPQTCNSTAPPSITVPHYTHGSWSRTKFCQILPIVIIYKWKFRGCLGHSRFAPLRGPKPDVRLNPNRASKIAGRRGVNSR